MNYSLLKNTYIKKLAKFVVEENYKHHHVSSHLKCMEQEIIDICKDEIKYLDKKIFVANDLSENIVGSIRVFKWNKIDILPMEKIFNINTVHLIEEQDIEIWHIGRFAIKKGVDNRGFQIFKTLMVCAINEVCKNHGSIALAECDSKLLKILRLLDIEAVTLSTPINYLGSETIPVLITYESLKKFLNNHLGLLPSFLRFEYNQHSPENVTA